MSVLVVYPSCNEERAKASREAWEKQGYGVMVGTDGRFGRYPGYFAGCNQLIASCWRSTTLSSTGHTWQWMEDESFEVFVCAADDIYPDPDQTADEILTKYKSQFPDLDGVMQPVGDDLGGTSEICGSPWIGRKFIENAYAGFGPYHPAYRQFYGDEELMCVAEKMGKLWMVKSVTQRHEHWLRPGIEKTENQIYNQRYWDHDAELFKRRKALGFPGALP